MNQCNRDLFCEMHNKVDPVASELHQVHWRVEECAVRVDKRIYIFHAVVLGDPRAEAGLKSDHDHFDERCCSAIGSRVGKRCILLEMVVEEYGEHDDVDNEERDQHHQLLSSAHLRRCWAGSVLFRGFEVATCDRRVNSDTNAQWTVQECDASPRQRIDPLSSRTYNSFRAGSLSCPMEDYFPLT